MIFKKSWHIPVLILILSYTYYVCVDTHGLARGYLHLIKKWIEAVGLDPASYGTHTLRKTWGYHARKNFGIPIELISEKLDHSSNAVTKRYIGISQEEINNIEKKVCL